MQLPGIELKGGFNNTETGNVDWWYGEGGAYWSSLEYALSKIPVSKRPILTIGVKVGSVIKEYWWPDETKLTDQDITLKLSEAIPVDLTPYAKTIDVDQKISTITKEFLGIDKVDNTPDSLKPISIPVEAALNTKADKTAVELITSEITTIKDNTTEEINEFLLFTYLGTNNKIKLSFTPRNAGLVFLSGTKLNLYEYRFENDYLVLTLEDLKMNINYTIDITYLK